MTTRVCASGVSVSARSGSGNGLARELGIPIEPRAAFDAVLGAPTCRIDAGELDGRPFFNVAGLGLDAAVAHRFAGGLGLKRGLGDDVVIAPYATAMALLVDLRAAAHNLQRLTDAERHLVLCRV